MQEHEKHEKLASDDWEGTLVPNKKRRRIVTYLIAIIAIGLIFAGRVLISSQNGTGWLSGGLFGKLKHLMPSVDKQLKGEEEDRINILLLGIGGEGHDGPYLTDTMMLASIKPSTKQVSLVSIPRDLVAPVSNWQKINSINAYAEQKTPGSGGEVTSKAMEELFQVPIDYYVRVDFNGFANIIDELGGIQVNVENTLDDYSYPIEGQENNPNYYARFEHLHIEKGLQTMNGSLALKYTRSRHALGAEGSDFARARRQQLVLEAIKSKILSKQTLLNPVTIGKLINEFNKDISTNLDVWEMLRLWNLVKDVDRSQIINKVLSDAPDGFLVAGKGEEGAYILTPRTGNFSDIRKMIQDIFSTTTSTPEAPKKIETIKDDAKVVILNGTWVSGLASKTAVMLEQSRFSIHQIGNASERNYNNSIIYDLTSGSKNASLTTLKKISGASLAYDSPEWLKIYQDSSSTPDFILILGTDADKD